MGSGSGTAPFQIHIEQRQDQTIPPQGLVLGELPAAQFTPAGIYSDYVVERNHPDSFIQSWTLNIQRELTQNLKLEVAYIGNKVSHIDRMMFYNIRRVPGAETGQGCGSDCPIARPFPRPYPAFGEDRTQSAIGWSNYNAMQINLERRFSQGLTFQANFNWNKGMDGGVESQGDFISGGQPDAQPENLFNLKAEKARSGDSPGKRFVTSWVYQLPFGTGKQYLNSAHPAVKALVGGWMVSGILSLQSGFPFEVHASGDVSGTGTGRMRANRIAVGNLPPDQRTLNRWFDTSAFELPPLNTFGTGGRRIMDGPGVTNVDLNLAREFKITERHHLQFRAEFFNAFNHPNFAMPNFYVTSSNFGKITSTSGPPRSIQFALKYVF
jgi:hypothetical protein